MAGYKAFPCLCGDKVQSPLCFHAHSWVTVQSSERGTRSVCWPVSHTFPFPPSTWSQWFPSSTWILTRSWSFSRQLWCKPAAWHVWHGLAQLGSMGSQRRWQGLLCVPWSCAAASVSFCWLLKVFLCAEGVYGYLVVCGVVGLGGGFCLWHCCIITVLVFGVVMKAALSVRK